jgi:hypothetical protein
MHAHTGHGYDASYYICAPLWRSPSRTLRGQTFRSASPLMPADGQLAGRSGSMHQELPAGCALPLNWHLSKGRSFAGVQPDCLHVSPSGTTTTAGTHTGQHTLGASPPSGTHPHRCTEPSAPGTSSSPPETLLCTLRYTTSLATQACICHLQAPMMQWQAYMSSSCLHAWSLGDGTRIWDQALLQPTGVSLGKLQWSPSRGAAVPYVPIPFLNPPPLHWW